MKIKHRITPRPNRIGMVLREQDVKDGECYRAPSGNIYRRFGLKYAALHPDKRSWIPYTYDLWGENNLKYQFIDGNITITKDPTR